VTLTVVVPARNEEENIAATLEGLLPVCDPADSEIVVVDDHSTDATGERTAGVSRRAPHVRLVRNEGEPGFANALKAGFAAARGEFVLPVMADACDDPATIPPMLAAARAGCDMVCGSRYIPGGGRVGGPFVQGIFSFLVGKSLAIVARLPTSDVSNAFKLYRRSVLLSLPLAEKGFAVSMEAALGFWERGCRIADVPTVWYGRKKGASKFRLSKTLPYARLYLRALRRSWTSRS